MLHLIFLFFVLAQSAVVAHPFKCFTKAVTLKDQFWNLLNQVDAIKLCKGSADLRPVECYEKAIADKDVFGSFVILFPLKLCSGARGYFAVECYKEAIQSKDSLNINLSPQLALEICSSN